MANYTRATATAMINAKAKEIAVNGMVTVNPGSKMFQKESIKRFRVSEFISRKRRTNTVPTKETDYFYRIVISASSIKTADLNRQMPSFYGIQCVLLMLENLH